MNFYDIIDKKRKGETLSKKEIDFWISGLTKETIPTYQSSALAMAIAINDMNDEETFYLTQALKHSGKTLSLDKINGYPVDKHSTGGVGDKATLIIAPMVAACGGKVVKVSGRGLGHTGGTLDKLESIPGLSTDKTQEEFINQVNKIGLAVIGQNKAITPGDKKLYALRDVTATVESIPLIASSIMSKKLAAGTPNILLDVTVGKGAFMKNIKSALRLAETMVNIGHHFKKDVRAIISNMDEPLGHAVGNSLEIIEAVDVLQGKKVDDLLELCYLAGSIMLVQSRLYKNIKVARRDLEKAIADGSAFNKFVEMVEAQGGDVSVVKDTRKFPKSKYCLDIISNNQGYIKSLDALKIGHASMELGAGRHSLEDKIDYKAGIYLYKKVGDYVKYEEKLATIYTDKEEVNDIINHILSAYTFSKDKVNKPKLIFKVL